MEIKYFDHPHHLLSLSKTKYDLIDCPICLEKLGSIGTQNYICSTEGCKYGVHESCAKLPREVQNPYHPHPLTLRRPLILGRLDFYSSKCNGCRKYDKGFVYSCDDCDFKLGLECAFMGPVKVIEGEGGCQGQLRKHPNHQQHPLLLFEMVPNKHYKCPVCLKYCSDPDPTYGCWECCLYLHDGSCFETKLPPQIQHFYHPHPLTLSTTPRNVKCRACYEWSWNIIWYYSCKQCEDFGMDIPCALSILAASTTTKSESQIQHFLHGHTLSLNKNKLDDQKVADCCVCGKGCTGPTIYVCGRDGNCKNIYFHKSCLEFPQQICHPFHPYHPLTLTLVEQNFYHLKKCNACRKSIHTFILYGHCSFAFICEGHKCDFLLHAECSTVMMPVITYEGHAHLLQFRHHNIENNKLNCSACKSNICEASAFTCLDCDLNLHLLCGPLPHSIKHKDHNVHPLLLTNSPVQEELEDETDEFYCHACEEERDPQLPVYYCAECQFVAEIKCVFSEVR